LLTGIFPRLVGLLFGFVPRLGLVMFGIFPIGEKMDLGLDLVLKARVALVDGGQGLAVGAGRRGVEGGGLAFFLGREDDGAPGLVWWRRWVSEEGPEDVDGGGAEGPAAVMAVVLDEAAGLEPAQGFTNGFVGVAGGDL
jgi:hypothetical protein